MWASRDAVPYSNSYETDCTARLSQRNEPDVQLLRGQGAEDEATRLHARDRIDGLPDERMVELMDGQPQHRRIAHQRRDVAKHHSGPRKPGNRADLRFKALHWGSPGVLPSPEPVVCTAARLGEYAAVVFRGNEAADRQHAAAQPPGRGLVSVFVRAGRFRFVNRTPTCSGHPPSVARARGSPCPAYRPSRAPPRRPHARCRCGSGSA